MSRRPNNFLAERVTLSFDHAALTANAAVKLYKVPAGRSFVLDRAAYINPTGLVEDNADNFAGAVKNGSVVMATLFNTDANLVPDTGASLAANTFVEGALSATATELWAAPADVVSVAFTLTGTQTLPVGRLVLEGRLF